MFDFLVILGFGMVVCVLWTAILVTINWRNSRLVTPVPTPTPTPAFSTLICQRCALPYRPDLSRASLPQEYCSECCEVAELEMLALK